MKALTYIEHGKFALLDKPKPLILDPRDAVVRVTLGSICTSDLHIKHGSVPRAVPGITVGHEMVGVVEEVGSAVGTVKPGDRVTVNVETFCGECFFCQHGYVNNCTDRSGGWALGCRIDGGQAEFVRVPYADQGRAPLLPICITGIVIQVSLQPLFAISEGKIVLLVFAEVQSLGLRGDTLEGVVAELAAVVAMGHDSLFGAEHHIFVHFRTVAAIVAGTLHLFAEQHSNPFLSGVIIHHSAGNFQCHFQKKDGRGKKKTQSSELQICGRSNSPQEGVDGLLGNAGLHSQTGGDGQTADLQKDTDAAEAHKDRAQKNCQSRILRRQRKNAARQLQQPRQEHGCALRQQREHPPPQKSGGN